MTRYISDRARRLVAEKFRHDACSGESYLRGWAERALAAPVFAISPEAWVDWALTFGRGDMPVEGLVPASPCWIESTGIFALFLFTIDHKHFDSFYAFDSKGFWFEGDRTAGETMRWRFEVYKESLQPRAYAEEADIGRVIGTAYGIADAVSRFQSIASERPLSVGRKMQARKGKGRVFKHYEIDLSRVMTSTSAATHGGTHASPAWHIRRGHMRRLKDGRQVFVRSCEVGSKERGVVLKDYTLGQGEARP